MKKFTLCSVMAGALLLQKAHAQESTAHETI